MSVLIRGMKIPKSCGVCIFDDYGHCIMTKRYSGGSATHGRASFCPLVGLPEKHGRLIDADVIVNAMNDMKVEGEVFVTAVNYVKLIMNDADTIIEAEGENDNRKC